MTRFDRFDMVWPFFWFDNTGFSRIRFVSNLRIENSWFIYQEGFAVVDGFDLLTFDGLQISTKWQRPLHGQKWNEIKSIVVYLSVEESGALDSWHVDLIHVAMETPNVRPCKNQPSIGKPLPQELLSDLDYPLVLDREGPILRFSAITCMSWGGFLVVTTTYEGAVRFRRGGCPSARSDTLTLSVLNPNPHLTRSLFRWRVFCLGPGWFSAWVRWLIWTVDHRGSAVKLKVRRCHVWHCCPQIVYLRWVRDKFRIVEDSHLFSTTGWDPLRARLWAFGQLSHRARAVPMIGWRDGYGWVDTAICNLSGDVLNVN